MMVSAQPSCPTEPVKGGGFGVDAAAKDASDDFKARLPRVPTGSRCGTREGSTKESADSPDHYKSLLSPAWFKSFFVCVYSGTCYMFKCTGM